MLEIVPKGMTAWQWECRHARLWADPDQQNAHVKAWRDTRRPKNVDARCASFGSNATSSTSNQPRIKVKGSPL